MTDFVRSTFRRGDRKNARSGTSVRAGRGRCLRDLKTKEANSLGNAIDKLPVTSETERQNLPASSLGVFRKIFAAADANLSDNPHLNDYMPSERRAIIRYCCELGMEFSHEIDFTEIVHDWEESASAKWRRAKMRVDGQKQLKEIERHKYIVSQKLGYDIGWERAATDWIASYAAEWRAWWEHQAEACP